MPTTAVHTHANPPMTKESHLTFDLNALGLNSGNLIVAAGADSEAIALPVISINKGKGPQLLITAGCHGNEFEGPIVARRLIDWLPETQIRGRIIIVPVLNPPAVQASTRNTPIDNINLNRAYPGRADGSVSERIADAVSRLLLPFADIVFDLHSFGPSWDLPPSSTTHPIADPDLMRRTVRLAEAFELPLTLIWNHDDTPGMFDTLVQDQGKLFVCAELGGGTVGCEDVAIGEAAVRSALMELGFIEEKEQYPRPLHGNARLTLETVKSEVPRSPDRGIFEPCCKVLQTIENGDLIGILHPIDSPASASVSIYASDTAVVCAIRSGGYLDRGEQVALLAAPYLVKTRKR